MERFINPANIVECQEGVIELAPTDGSCPLDNQMPTRA